MLCCFNFVNEDNVVYLVVAITIDMTTIPNTQSITDALRANKGTQGQ